MHKLLPLLALFALAAAPAYTAGLLIDLRLSGSAAVGEYEDQFGPIDASDVFDTGVGLGAGISYGLGRNLYLGLQLDLYRNSGESFDFGAGPFGYDLTSIPVHGVLQYVSIAGAGGIGFGVKGGVGFTRHSLSLDLAGVEDPSQTSFSFLLGGDVAYGLTETWSLTAGLGYHQTMTGTDCGELADDEGPFCDDDNPKFLLFLIGARFHRD